jgi:hypothetical protein
VKKKQQPKQADMLARLDDLEMLVKAAASGLANRVGKPCSVVVMVEKGDLYQFIYRGEESAVRRAILRLEKHFPPPPPPAYGSSLPPYVGGGGAAGLPGMW